MARKPEQDFTIVASSGNVFADIGVPEPEEELAKAQLARYIRQVIKRRRLTQIAAASQMGIDQPKVSAIRTYKLTGISLERLMQALTALGQHVEIIVRPCDRNTPARINVAA